MSHAFWFVHNVYRYGQWVLEIDRAPQGWRIVEKNDNVVETEFDIKVPFDTQLDLHSFSGKLQVIDVSGSIDAQTFSGEVELDVARGGRVPALNVQTFSGDIRAKFPADASGQVEFNSFSGDIDSELPFAMHSTRRSGRKDASGALGSGDGSTLKFKTFSGDLKISR